MDVKEAFGLIYGEQRRKVCVLGALIRVLNHLSTSRRKYQVW